MMLNATFNNISVLSQRSVLLVEETEENHRPVASHWQTLSHSVVSSTPCHERGSNSVTYFARADNMLLPFTRGQITCYCPRKMLLPRSQITRRKLCFYYTCKFGVISIKYVIMINTSVKTNGKKRIVTRYFKVLDLFLQCCTFGSFFHLIIV
jgi:hypothetical protein